MTARTVPMVLDPGTSSDAAELGTAVRDRAKGVIMSILAERGALTDDELVRLYRERAHAYTSVPLITPQSIRTRRHELVVAGQVREAGIGRSALGNRSTMWALA